MHCLSHAAGGCRAQTAWCQGSGRLHDRKPTHNRLQKMRPVRGARLDPAAAAAQQHCVGLVGARRAAVGVNGVRRQQLPHLPRQLVDHRRGVGGLQGGRPHGWHCVCMYIYIYVCVCVCVCVCASGRACLLRRKTWAVCGIAAVVTGVVLCVAGPAQPTSGVSSRGSACSRGRLSFRGSVPGG